MDPLAEKHPDYSPYVYCANNPILYVDPDGRDWIHWYAKDGTRHITYDKSVTTVEQANQKGYNNYNKEVLVSPGAHLKVSETEQYYMNPDGMVSNGKGSSVDIADGHISTSNSITISYAKTGIDQLLEVGGVLGDAITLIGLVTLQPELVFVGGHLGNGILAGTVVNSFNKEGINEETITKNGTKVVANRVFNGLGNSAVKATQNVAGKKFVVSGANKVSESVIQGTVMMGEKTTDVIINENKQ